MVDFKLVAVKFLHDGLKDAQEIKKSWLDISSSCSHKSIQLKSIVMINAKNSNIPMNISDHCTVLYLSDLFSWRLPPAPKTDYWWALPGIKECWK